MGLPRLLVVLALGASLTLAADPPRAKVEFRRAETKTAEGLTEVPVVGSDTKIFLHKEVDLNGDDVASTRVLDDKDTGPAVEIVFTKEGVKKAAKMSKEHADKPIAIVVDGKVIFAPIVKSELGEKIVITGKFTKAEAEKLAKSIKPE
jgi:preprotein translocase subunit SecD